PNGLSTTWYFQYGTSTNYGSQTGSSNAGSGTTSTNVSASLDGLSPGTTYHYRLVATNSSGTTQGADAVLTTSGAPAPTAVTGAASAVTPTGATLNGSVNPNGRPTTWHFEYGTSTGYGSTTTAQNAGSGTSPVNVSAPVSGLTTGPTYHFRLVATNATGTSVGADQSFATEGPPAVTTGSAQNVSTSSATLTGSVDPRNHSTSWYFEYGTSTSYGTRTATQTASADSGNRGVSVGIGGLAVGAADHYRLVESSIAGTRPG